MRNANVERFRSLLYVIKFFFRDVIYKLYTMHLYIRKQRYPPYLPCSIYLSMKHSLLSRSRCKIHNQRNRRPAQDTDITCP